jgi:hypothetical protein
MRSSPNCLGVSRREGTDFNLHREALQKLYLEEELGRSRRDDDDGGELKVHLRISYKTLVLVFITFDVIQHIIDAIRNLF